MADDSARREPPPAPIGRVRLAEPSAPSSPDGAADDPDGNGWSPAGVGLALLMILIMVGALVIILWAAFQTRA